MICSICTGRHHTSACRVAARYLEQCSQGTPDDYVEPAPPVIETVMAHTYVRERERMAVQRHVQRTQAMGVHATRIGKKRSPGLVGTRPG